MAKLQQHSEWKARWEERGAAVRKVLGDSIPNGSVTPFSWKQFLLPGACAMSFRMPGEVNEYLTMTLGLTQPLEADLPSYPWEFSIKSKKIANWQTDLLYQLVTQWLCENKEMGFGYQLPLLFFNDPYGKLWAGLTGDSTELNVVGDIRSMVLWLDDQKIRFRTSTDEFGLLSVVAITGDEERLAEESSPAHLLLLMHQLGLKQTCDPYRKSVLRDSRWRKEWSQIQRMSNDEAFDRLTAVQSS